MQEKQHLRGGLRESAAFKALVKVSLWAPVPVLSPRHRCEKNRRVKKAQKQRGGGRKTEQIPK